MLEVRGFFTWEDKSDISTFPESWRVTDFTPPSTTFLAADNQMEKITANNNISLKCTYAVS